MEWNPRYIAYAAAHGKTPAVMLEHDKKVWPGSCMCGFSFWIKDKIREFVSSGKGCCKKCAGDSPEFTPFLRTFSKLK